VQPLPTDYKLLVLATTTMNLKKYLPFENYSLTTNLSTTEIYKRLSDNIEPRKAFRFSLFNQNSTKPYEGEIYGNTFSMSRIINYRNSFLPIIKGDISMFAGQTQINIKMRPVTFVLIFISFWLGTVGLLCVSMLLVGLLQIKQLLKTGFSPMVLIPFGMFIFGYLLTTLAFKAESSKSKKFLTTLLDAHETT